VEAERYEMTNSSELRCVIEAIIISVPGNMFHNRALTALAAIVRESGEGQRPSDEAQAEAVESALMRVNGTHTSRGFHGGQQARPVDCAECGRALGTFHRPECGKRVIGHPTVVSDDTVKDAEGSPALNARFAEVCNDLAPLVLELDEPFECGYCGRPELECSFDPCPDVIADRGEPSDPREER